MTWRTGGMLFRDIWPTIDRYIDDDRSGFKDEFLRDLVELFMGCDMDPADLFGLDEHLDTLLNRWQREGLF